MRSGPILALVLGALTLAAPSDPRAREADSVVACETLISARRIDAASGAAAPAPSEAGCHHIPRSDVGPVEQRALIGSTPYECVIVANAGRCLWLVP